MTYLGGPTPGWGSITLGRFTLRETFDVTEDQGRVLQIHGQTSVAGLTAAQVERIYEDLYGLQGQLVPISWSDKAFLNGFYQVGAIKTTYASYTPGRVASPYPRAVVLDWSCDATRIGPENSIDLESKLSGPQTRKNSYSGVGEITHAPPPVHYGYTTGGSVPPSLQRATSEGPITVYRQIPQGTHPRWGCSPLDFGGGRARFIDAFGEERTGMTRTTPPNGWLISNGIVRVGSGGAGTLTIGSYVGGVWQTREWDILRNGVSVAPFTAATVLANTFDTVILRLVSGGAPGNPTRTTVDVQMRRGARLAEVFIASDNSATLKAVLHTGEPGLAGPGSISSIGEAIDGGRFVIVSANAVTNDLVSGGMSMTSARLLSVAIGAIPAATPLNPNYSFETGTSGWTAAGGVLTQSNEQVKYGSFAGKLVSDGTSISMSADTTNIAITPLTKYTAGAWLRCPHGRQVTVTLTWKNSGGGAISTVVKTANLAADTWTPFLLDTSSPALATQASISISTKQTVPWSALSAVHWNALLTWQRPIAFVETLYIDSVPLRPALDGDSVADMAAQHLGAVSEQVVAVKR